MVDMGKLTATIIRSRWCGTGSIGSRMRPANSGFEGDFNKERQAWLHECLMPDVARSSRLQPIYVQDFSELQEVLQRSRKKGGNVSLNNRHDMVIVASSATGSGTVSAIGRSRRACATDGGRQRIYPPVSRWPAPTASGMCGQNLPFSSNSVLCAIVWSSVADDREKQRRLIMRMVRTAFSYASCDTSK